MIDESSRSDSPHRSTKSSTCPIATFRVLFVTSGWKPSLATARLQLGGAVHLLWHARTGKGGGDPTQGVGRSSPAHRALAKAQLGQVDLGGEHRLWPPGMILAADYKVKRVMLHENNARDDGSLCEGHPDFSRVVNELEALNANTSGVVYEDSQLVPEPKRRKSKAKAPKESLCQGRSLTIRRTASRSRPSRRVPNQTLSRLVVVFFQGQFLDVNPLLIPKRINCPRAARRRRGRRARPLLPPAPCKGSQPHTHTTPQCQNAKPAARRSEFRLPRKLARH